MVPYIQNCIFEHSLLLYGNILAIITTSISSTLTTCQFIYLLHHMRTHTLWIVDANSKISHLDLGTGIGSVLLMMAWRFHPFHAPDNRGAAIAQSLGVEAQEDHVNLARRSIALNGCGDTCRVVHADIAKLLNGIETV